MAEKKRSTIVVSLDDPANPHRKKNGKRSRCGGRGSHGLVGTYGVPVTPIDIRTAIGVGLLDEDGHRSYGGEEELSWDAKQAKRLGKILGITYELSCKCFKNQLDRFEISEFAEAVERRLKHYIDDDDLRLVEKVVQAIADKRKPTKPRLGKGRMTASTASAAGVSWKKTRMCPHCGVQGRLAKDFRFCPLCGGKLP